MRAQYDHWKGIPLREPMRIADIVRGRLLKDKSFKDVVIGGRLNELRAKPADAYDEDPSGQWDSDSDLEVQQPANPQGETQDGAPAVANSGRLTPVEERLDWGDGLEES